MEKETTLNNELNQSPLLSNEANQIQENLIIEESKMPEEPKKLSLSDINPSDLTEKIENFFCEKLETLESKFQNDLVIVEPFKFQFIDLYHDLENLKEEILDFLKKEEEKKTNLKKPATGTKAITRNNTSKSRTPIKFNATSKLISATDVTKSANLKGNLNKSRSKTPLTAVKQNDKGRKDISVSKTETKNTLHTTANVSSTLNTTRALNTAKKPATALNASAKKRDLTPVLLSKAAKALDTSGISHNEPTHTEHGKSSGNSSLKNSKGNKSGIKVEAKANVASANIKKPAAAGLNGNESKKKSVFEEEKKPVSSFNSSVDLTAKKKSVLNGVLNISVNSDLTQGSSSNNNLVDNANNNKSSSTARASINKGGEKGERKASLPAQRGSLSRNKKNSMENVNGTVDEKREENISNNVEKANQSNIKTEVKRKSIEVKIIQIEDNKQIDNVINNNINEENKNVGAEAPQNDLNLNYNAEDKVIKETRKSISEMVFENQTIKQGLIIKEEKIISDAKIEANSEINTAIDENIKRQSITQEAEINKNDYTTNASEKAENDVKVAEERKKSVVNESVSRNAAASAESKKPEEFKVESTENKDTIETKSIELYESVKQPENTEAKSSNGVMKKSLLLSFSNKKSCALHLLIRSGLLTIKEQITAVYCNKELITSDLAEIKEDLFIFLKDKVAEYEDLISIYKNNLANLDIINKHLTFSKTAANGLNFVKKEEENNLLKKEQNEKIVDVFKFFCILLNENYESLPSNKVIEFFMLTVLPKYKIESLKKFVSEYITANIMNFDFSLEIIFDFVNKHHHILVSNELLSLNRSISYVTFSNKEIFEFLSTKLSDGNYAHYNRKAYGLIKRYNKILNKLGQ